MKTPLFCGGYFPESRIFETIKQARENNQELYLSLFPRQQFDENERLFFSCSGKLSEV